MIQKKPDLAAFSCLATDDAEGLARLVETWPDWEERAMCVSKGVEQTLLERAIEIAPQCARFLAGKSQGRQQDRQEKKTLSMALMRAIEAQNAELVQILAPKASLEASWKGFLPLSLAAGLPDAACVKALLDAGADPEAQSDSMANALMRAVHNDQLGNVKLLAPRTTLRRVDKQGRSPLMIAITYEMADCAVFLAPISDWTQGAPAPLNSKKRVITPLDAALKRASEGSLYGAHSMWRVVDELAVLTAQGEYPTRSALEKAKSALKEGEGKMPKTQALFDARALRQAVSATQHAARARRAREDKKKEAAMASGDGEGAAHADERRAVASRPPAKKSQRRL